MMGASAAVSESIGISTREDASLGAKITALRSVSTYPTGTQRIEDIETHFAWVFLAGNRVYKLKKPVRNDYVDLTTAAARRLACQEEVRLNRRLAQDTYSGISPLNRASDGSLRIDGPGVAVDWLVSMRRLPAALMLDRLIVQRAVPESVPGELGRILADFYQQQPRIQFEPHAYIERIAEQIRTDRRDLYAPDLDLDPVLIQSAMVRVWCAFSQVEAELALRAYERRIVEAHGDLRPEHICLTGPLRIIDALDFSLDLRTLDPAEELAFLTVECARLGGAQTAQDIRRACLQAMTDPVSAQLIDFYCSRRAMVRAKLMAWHLRDPQFCTLGPWREHAHSYLWLAIKHAQQACSPVAGSEPVSGDPRT